MRESQWFAWLCVLQLGTWKRKERKTGLGASAQGQAQAQAQERWRRNDHCLRGAIGERKPRP